MLKQAVLERIMNVRDWGGIHNKTLAKSEKKPRLGRSRPRGSLIEREDVSLSSLSEKVPWRSARERSYVK